HLLSSVLLKFFQINGLVANLFFQLLNFIMRQFPDLHAKKFVVVDKIIVKQKLDQFVLLLVFELINMSKVVEDKTEFLIEETNLLSRFFNKIGAADFIPLYAPVDEAFNDIFRSIESLDGIVLIPQSIN